MGNGIPQAWKAYGLSGGSLALVLLLTLGLEPLQDTRPYLLFFPAMMGCAWWGGRRVALGAIVLSAFAVHVWVLTPDPLWGLSATAALQLGAFVAVTVGMSAALSALVASRARLAVTLAHIGDAVIVTDRQGRVTFLNEVAATLTGWSPQEARGRDLTAIFRLRNMHTREAVESPVAHVLRTGHGVDRATPTLLLAKDDTEWPIDDRAAPMRTPAGDLLGVVLVFRALTERLRAEAVQTRLAAIVESADDAIISKTLEGVITSWNRGAERLYGYPAADMVGQPIARLIPPDLADDFPMIMARLRRGERLEHYETQRLAKDGTRRDVSLTISPLRDTTGQVVGASKIARDITAQKQAAATLEARVAERTAALAREMAERQRLEQAAHQAAHFALLGRLAAGVSHELRNPLAAVFLHIDLLDEELRDQAPESSALVADVLTEIRQQLARVDTLVQDYLSLVRVAQMARVPQDLGALLCEWSAEWQALATARSITCQWDGLAALGMVAVHTNTLARAAEPRPERAGRDGRGRDPHRDRAWDGDPCRDSGTGYGERHAA